MDVTKVRPWRCSSTPFLDREVQVSHTQPWLMLGSAPRIPRLAHEFQGQSRWVEGYSLSPPGFLGVGMETGSINGGKVCRTLPSRSLWVGRHCLRALDALGVGWRFSRKAATVTLEYSGASLWPSALAAHHFPVSSLQSK